MSHAIDNGDGTLTFGCDYPGVFTEPGNKEAVIELRAQLRQQRIPVKVVLQPGDATRYEFLLVPSSYVLTMSNDSHDPQRVPRLEQPYGDYLIVVCFTDMMMGTVTIAPNNEIGGIRHRLAEYGEIRNPCTAEALARLVEAAWSDNWEKN